MLTSQIRDRLHTWAVTNCLNTTAGQTLAELAAIADLVDARDDETVLAAVKRALEQQSET